jgi:hypothetical protein
MNATTKREVIAVLRIQSPFVHRRAASGAGLAGLLAPA